LLFAGSMLIDAALPVSLKVMEDSPKKAELADGRRQ
jgi:hypothetical protein